MTDLERPASIGRYQVLDILGSGAMGTVFKAYDPVIGRNVAIKVIRIDAASPQDRVASIMRFRAEVQAAGRCAHRAIVGVYDFLEQSGDPAIVMELVEGSSLHAVIRDPAQRAALSVPDMLLQVLDGLGYAHGQGIIHRDIKPANILLTQSGQVKIADFGIARMPETSVAQTGTVAGGAMMGTPSYMAPEQLTDNAVDRRADLFAVGAILYEIVTGRPPFAGRTVSETIMRLSGPDPVDLTPVSVAAPNYVTLLRRALAKDRTQRFQTADAFAAGLQLASGTGDPQETVVVVAPRGATATLDPGVIGRVERELARFVGPMARAMVQRAARTAATAGDLHAALAHELPTQSERSQFLRAVGAGRVEPSLGGRSRSGETAAPMTASGLTQPRTQAAASGAITPQAAAAAQAALVEYVGPIARVLVRDAAAKALSVSDFIERLCLHVDKPDVRARLQRRLRAEIGLTREV